MNKIYLGLTLFLMVFIQGCITSELADLSTSPSTSATSIVDSVTENFVEKNQRILAEEASQGQGPHLEALARLVGCDTGSYGEFSGLLHSSYQDIEPSEEFSSKGFLTTLSQNIETHPTLSDTCRHAG